MSKITNYADAVALEKLLKETNRIRQNIIGCYVKSCIENQEIPEIREELDVHKDNIINSFLTIFQKIPGGNHVVVKSSELNMFIPPIFEDYESFFEIFDMTLIKETEEEYQLVANFIAELY